MRRRRGGEEEEEIKEEESEEEELGWATCSAAVRKPFSAMLL